MFGTDEAAAYLGFKTEMLRDRVAGKWNVTAVVADADDYRKRPFLSHARR